jgi:Mrp family chromosome partitioning ATPase
VKNLSILPAGATPDGAIPSCDRTLVTDLISALRSDFSFAVFDLPAATELTSCFVFASHLDAILLVIEAEKTRGEAVQRSLDQLRDAGAFLLGTVLNKHRSYFPKWLYQSL